MASALWLSGHDAGRLSASEPASDGDDVARLIEKLGSPSYASRMRARERLQRMGLDAFDQLHNAQYHPDIEIANAARHLISSLLVSWSKESDPPEVREALEEYGAQSESERASRIELLADLPGRMGLPALARLVRFEPSLRLSEQAALVLMRQTMSDDGQTRRQHADAIREAIGANDRPAAEWLRVYADDLSKGRFDVEQWRELVTRQRHLVESAATEVATTASVLELVRVCAARASDLGRRAEALSLAGDHLDLVPPRTRELIDASSWAIDHSLHPLVLRLRERHPKLFERHPVLLYGAAEALVHGGDREAAESVAAEASQINPLPSDAEAREELSPSQLEELAQAHREIGQELASRGLFRWAEREYRHVIDSLEVDSLSSAFTRVHLARMLGELEQHDEVVELLEPLIQRIDQDEQFRRRLNNAMFSNTVRSDQEFHRGLGLIRKGRGEAAAPVLEKAWDLSNPPNIDILIAMYHLDAGEEWNRHVREILQRTIRMCEADIRNAEIKARQMGQFGFGDEQLANELNQYAWLVSNTEGDQQRALRYSERSLELSPGEPALLDTCARCHFALGDVTTAIRFQNRALRQMPHSPPMLRQLEEFERQAESTQVSPAEAAAEADAS